MNTHTFSEPTKRHGRGVGWLAPMRTKTVVHATCFTQALSISVHEHKPPLQAPRSREQASCRQSVHGNKDPRAACSRQHVRSRQQGLAGLSFTATRPRRVLVHGNRASQDPRSRDNAPRTLGAGGLVKSVDARTLGVDEFNFTLLRNILRFGAVFQQPLIQTLLRIFGCEFGSDVGGS